MIEYSQYVLDTFFQSFYTQRIESMIRLDKTNNRYLDIAALLFWFSVIDFYGGIYYIGKYNKKKSRKIKNSRDIFILAHNQSFCEFIKTFFPPHAKKFGELIYSIFRSGIVHQLSPKRGGLVFEPLDPRLVWIEGDSVNNNIKNKIAVLNSAKFEQYSFEAYSEFKRQIENSELVEECKNIYNQLLAQPDGLEDGIAFEEQYRKLFNISE